MTGPWVPVAPLDDRAHATVRRRAIFEADKWDPQVGDTATIARYPLVITREAWADVSATAEALARETAAAEAELVQRPELYGHLGLPRRVRRALREAKALGATPGAARLVRFDFHFTREGWRISEANSDVPGGLNEAAGLPPLMLPHYAGTGPVGDPVEAYAQAIAAATGGTGVVALVHATAYSDDQQMMVCVSRRLQRAGLSAHLASPMHLAWREGEAWLDAAWWRGRLDAVIRFFPADWLQGLSAATGWPHFFAGGRTPVSNPGTAILTQSKRLPLVWDELRTPLPTWRRMLPDTRDPRSVPWARSDDWIVKPALGRVGEGVGMAGLVDAKEMRRIARSVRWWPGSWIAQRRFETLPVEMGGERRFPCLGVYTVDGRVAGAYARLSATPLVDARAVDAALLAA
jgi:glutathionylspermidine synthase